MEIWAAALGATAAATSIGLSASGALNPAQPDLGSANTEISNANTALLPLQRQLESQAELGQLHPQNQALIPYETALQKDIDQLKLKPDAASKAKLAYDQSQLDKSLHSDTTDYSKFGGANTKASIAEQSAGKQLALQQKYSPQFIAEALKEEQLANPEGVAARDRESQLIQQQINNPITNPLASTLESQIAPQIQAGKGLDEFDKDALDNAVSKAMAARGGDSGGANYEEPLTTGLAGNARQLAGIQAGQNFLSSGVTPEDVSYRQNQQNIANLSNEVNGATPTSEFGSLSAASHSANPTSSGVPLATAPNSLQTGGNGALTQYANQAGSANSWLSGISSAVNLAGTVRNIQGGG